MIFTEVRRKSASNNNPRILSVPPILSVLRVSPKAIAGAFKSFHSLLSPNTDTHSVVFTEDKGEKVQEIITIPQNPSVSPFSPILRVSPKARALATNLCARDANGTQRRKGRRGRRAVTQQIH